MADATETIGRGLGRKVGPLPVWGWAVVVVAVGAGAYYLILRPNQQAQGQATPTPNLGNLAGLGYIPGAGGGVGGGTAVLPPTSVSTTPTYTSNADWYNRALAWAATNLQVPASQAQLYLQEFLAGNQPVGSPSAGGAYQNVISSVLTALGNPPSPVPFPNVNQNPFASNQNWLNSLLGFLPGGTPGSVQNELTALVNGTTTQISQAAANALTAAEGIVGQPPQPIPFSVIPPSTTPNPTPVPTGGGLTIPNFNNSIRTLAQALGPSGTPPDTALGLFNQTWQGYNLTSIQTGFINQLRGLFQQTVLQNPTPITGPLGTEPIQSQAGRLALFQTQATQLYHRTFG